MKVALQSVVRTFVIAALVLGGAVSVGSVLDEESPSPSPVPKPCSAPEYRQFDFWVGNWNVEDRAGKPAGANVIQSILAGCVLRERWTGSGGMNGESFNVFDAATKKWHQTWVDDRGSLLQLDGEFRDGKMILSGRRPGRDGGSVEQRITWEKIGGGSDRVRQLWEASRDAGGTWSVVFDGVYVRRR